LVCVPRAKTHDAPAPGAGRRLDGYLTLRDEREGVAPEQETQPVKRAALLSTVALAVLVQLGPAHKAAAQPAKRRGTTILYETAIGARLGRQPRPGVNDTRWFVSWDLGFMANRGTWAWGATAVASADEDGSRWGLRPRYRRWLGNKTALDVGAGILLGGGTNNALQDYPGFTGLVALSHGQWLGVSLEVQNVPTPDASGPDWGLYLGFRVNGLGAVVASVAELALAVAAAASMQ
jgi:hypothetical protein